MKKAKDIGKKNEGKEYKKKSENKIFKDYRKKINDKINERKEETLQYVKKDRKKKESKDETIEKEKEFIPITSFADFRNQLRVAVQKDRANINKIKRTLNKK